MTQKQTNIHFKIRIWIAISVMLLVLIAGICLKNYIFKPFRLKETVYIYIDEKKNYENIIAQLKEKAHLPSEKIFRIVADRMNYPQSIKSGRYAVKDGMTMPHIIQIMRSGQQTPVNLTFNNIRTKETLAGRIAQQLMVDSLSLLNALNDSVRIKRLGFNKNTIVAMFIPNTYQVYWDTSIDKFLARMKHEYNVFWTYKRKESARKIGLSPVQISTLASIVEEEATIADEYPIIAGLYLNRLRKGMKLEADPTVKYAIGDFSLQRILFKHLEINSPYNTYLHIGLPPGPIRVPSIKAIDGVLSAQQNKYLFMCAKADLSGRHNFSVTHSGHMRNAAAYQRALNQHKIY